MDGERDSFQSKLMPIDPAPLEYTDYPIDALAITMQEAIYKGGKAYLKFTCVYCHSRQTIDEANKLYTQGKCEECGTVTDIAKRGGNLLVILPVR